MSVTNTQLRNAAYALLQNASLGYSIAYPGVDFTPPATGPWLEIMLMPNQPLDDGLRPGDGIVPQGIIQINAVGRPGDGEIAVSQAADAAAGAFSKGTTIVAPVRVQRRPYQLDTLYTGDRITIPVTVPYSS